MKEFLDKDFLLSSDSALKLYNEYAKDMPIIDYHCHVSPKEIYEDTHFENISQLWLGGDHYKWRVMRSNGVNEEYITGTAPDREKFQKFAESLSKAIGNPMYHWCHLELKRYFNYNGVLNGDTAEEVWNLTLEKLKSPDMGVRGLIEKSNVSFIGTTDDPVDTLEWHSKIMHDKTMNTTVAPSFRPDKALNIDKTGFCNYIKTLSNVVGYELSSVELIKKALKARMDFFEKHGCKASDHGLDKAIYNNVSNEEADEVLRKALDGKEVTKEEADAYKTNLLCFCAEEYSKRGWAMQIHYNCLRNPNTAMFERLGPDTGFDCIGPDNGSKNLAKFLDHMYKNNSLPKTIIYSLDETDNTFIGSLIGAFQGDEIPGKIQHGSAWWFNDNMQGMKNQLISLANLGLLGNFIGMLTDSRSFLSYTRHEYFRRILCNLIGDWIENGELPADYTAAGKIIEDICFNNAKKYFKLED